MMPRSLLMTRRRACHMGVGALAGFATRSAAAQPEPVRPSQDFVNSVGVGTHITIPPYSFDYPRFRRLLAASGIRHVREELRPGNDSARWRDLQASAGIRWQLVVSPITNTVPEMLAWIDAVGATHFTAVEGQNEGDAAWFQAQKVAAGDWAATVVNYQRAMYQALRQRSDLATLKVVSPTLLDWKPGDVVPIRASAQFCDIVALHSYVQRAQEPETHEDHAALEWYIRNYRDPYKPGAPFMVSETGYTNVARRGGVSELATSVYLPRMLLHNFAAGAVRTFIYEFMDGGINPQDSEHNYGLVRYDGTPKPAYQALAALLNALRDDQPASRRLSGPPPICTFPDAPPDLRRQIFSRRDGSVVVALWRPLPVWSYWFSTDSKAAPVPVTISTAGRATKAAGFAVNTDPNWRTLVVADGSVTLPVGDRVVLVRLGADHV